MVNITNFSGGGNRGALISANGHTLDFAPCAACGSTDVHCGGVSIGPAGATVKNPACGKCGGPLTPIIDGKKETT